jgi:hypothetical protein
MSNTSFVNLSRTDAIKQRAVSLVASELSVSTTLATVAVD